MNLFQLVFKQMRQRALATWLTTFSVLLGVALAVSIFLVKQAGVALFAQTDYGFDVLVGKGSGSGLELTLNTIYHIYKAPTATSYALYERLNDQNRPPQLSKEYNFNQVVRTAVPIAVGDTYKGMPIVATPPKMFVSLSDTRQSVDDLRTSGATLLADLRAAGADAGALAARQADLQKAYARVRDEVKRISQETSPLLEQFDELYTPTADDSKWLYGKPIAFRAQALLDEGKSVADALAKKDVAAAVPHQQAVLDDLDAVWKSIGAENGTIECRPGQPYELADGRWYHAWKFEAVIGSDVAKKTGLKVGSPFHATHGNPGPKEIPDVHAEIWNVVGVLKPTHTAADRCLYIPLLSVYCIAEHEGAMQKQEAARNGQKIASTGGEGESEPYTMVSGHDLDPDLPDTKDFISLRTPKKEWEVAAVLVKSRGGVSGQNLEFFIKNGGMQSELGLDVMAVNPAEMMRTFFETFFGASTMILLIIAGMVSVVAAVGILVSIYNSVSARYREIAILRALGATRRRVLTLICTEAGFIGLFGAILGGILGHLLGGVGSIFLREQMGQGFNWISVSAWEIAYLGGVVLIALFAGLVPALKAYRTPVATNLVAA